MTIPETIVLVIVAAVTAIVTTVVGGIVARAFGVGPLAKEAAGQKSEMIEDLKTRLDLAESDVEKANDKADLAETRAASAEAQSNATELRRQGCEDEIARLKGDVRSLERELLDLHRRTGTPAPQGLISREARHRKEDRA